MAGGLPRKHHDGSSQGARRFLAPVVVHSIRRGSGASGAPLLGAVFAMGHFTYQSAAMLLLLMAGNAFLVAHIFMLNDWSGVHQDLRDPTRAAGFLSIAVFGAMRSGLVADSAGAEPHDPQPAERGNAGYCAVDRSGRRALLHPACLPEGHPACEHTAPCCQRVAAFFAGLFSIQKPRHEWPADRIVLCHYFSAGHLTQEVRDCEADLSNGIQTNAVKFGKKRSFIASFVLFTLPTPCWSCWR